MLSNSSLIIPPDTFLKALQDKSIEKRRAAALDIQNEIEDLMRANNQEAIKQKIKAFDLCTKEDGNAMRKRAGLYGISVITVALYQKGATQYLQQLIDPVMGAFKDNDTRVQQAACDALFNIIKIVREAILDKQEIFKKIFDGIINLIIDSATTTDKDIVEWAKSVDDLLKNQVYNALSRSHPFDLEKLIQYISEKLNVNQNPDVIVVLIKWVELLHSIQNVNILPSVPNFLDKLLSNIDAKNNLK